MAISSGFGQKIGNVHKITLSEELEVSNHEKYQKLVTATKQLTERHAIMDQSELQTQDYALYKMVSYLIIQFK